jgi:tetratricopeptide (TPR) repeat protein
MLSRSRSRRGSSAEPDSGSDVGGRSRSGSAKSNSKKGLRLPFRKGSSNSLGAANGGSSPPTQDEEQEEEEVPPPVPAIPRTLNGNGNASAYSKKDANVPEHPIQRQKSMSKSQEKDDQQQGYLGGAMAAVAGVGAAAGGAAAAIAGKVTGQANGQATKEEHEDEGSDEGEDFHDAELADIPEDADEADHQPPSPEAKNQSNRRHRGLSEGEGVALGAGASRSKVPNSKREKPEESIKSNDDSHDSTAIQGKRRSGSTPAADTSDSAATPNDQKAKKETPMYVREKAARVRKLTYDDVKMSESEMRADIKVARGALHLFLNSRMFEAEEIIAKYSDSKLYYALGDALIAVIKGFMTFEPVDLAKAISYCKDSLYMASLLRKPTSAVGNFGRFVRGTGQSPSSMASMDIVQKHAELIYAESLLLKAVMGILYSGDFIAFVSEALNMRNAYGIYRSLAKYVEWADKKASGSQDTSIDEDFRSGVHLGNGLISLILGLLPGKVLKIMEVIGYTGDTQEGLAILAKAGGWSKQNPKPGMDKNKEGIRRQVCDMGILLYHLVISTFLPVQGVDIDYSDKVLHYNLDRYPEGVFFLYFSGRLYSTQARAEKAIVQYRSARDVQKEYVQLQHICYWDMALCHMSLTQWKKANECFDLLFKDSNWSKCVYLYGRAANMYMDKSRRGEAAKLFHDVPGKMQRIAGKSIPMEKYCARKAKKFIGQDRLLLPAIEFSYIYHCLTNAPRYSLCDSQLVDISEALREINETEDPSQYHSGADEYWDDYCLAHFLRGVTLRYIAYPEKHAKVQPKESPIPQEEASEQAEISLINVIEASHRLALDHYICYFAHYELGRLRANQGRKDEAKEQFQLILSGKKLETHHKGKYSMLNMCTLRSNGAMSVL